MARGQGSIAYRPAQAGALKTKSEDHHDSEETGRKDPAKLSCEHQIDNPARLMMLSHSGS
ncbi:hypothetical protein GCM10017710_41230 [Arthrobacter ramosus]